MSLALDLKSEGVRVIRRGDYAVFAELKHLFLTGDLQHPNPHPFIHDRRVECIMCFYESGDNGVPHWHSTITEYEAVLEGEIGYRESLTGELTWFRAGDFSAIAAGVCVKRIVREPARTFAVKVPSGSERVVCAQCPRECPSRVSPFLG